MTGGRGTSSGRRKEEAARDRGDSPPIRSRQGVASISAALFFLLPLVNHFTRQPYIPYIHEWPRSPASTSSISSARRDHRVKLQRGTISAQVVQGPPSDEISPWQSGSASGREVAVVCAGETSGWLPTRLFRGPPGFDVFHSMQTLKQYSCLSATSALAHSPLLPLTAHHPTRRLHARAAFRARVVSFARSPPRS